ncbi:hypothetical protein [Tengunoibacter tsumagoiensis]|uniref:Uncharacterized protein n=1 Tax=Tengunoibacter tsumagoiensis TaxID=2014871 RepID=A0A402A026_9CHLR|nr:hypothetical protein [Tengunoibacter tsumagoiensis]GCE12419.1 hypothetical protein KTT_22780 [Tengunoibacter tsumagoiensis]
MSGTDVYLTPLYFIARAFWSFDQYRADEACEDFASRWSGLDISAFEEVAQEGERTNRLVVFLALDELKSTETSELL